MKKNKGITLIALVITIIVLLILAAVSIATLIGENGILSQAQKSQVETKKAEAEDIIKLVINEWQIEKNTSNNSLEDFLNSKVPDELDKVTKNEDGSFTVEVNGYKGTINDVGILVGKITKANEEPEKPVIETEPYLPTPDTQIIEADLSKGYTIKDPNENEWVWIEVPKSKMPKELTFNDESDYSTLRKSLETYAEPYSKGNANYPDTQNYLDMWYDKCVTTYDGKNNYSQVDYIQDEESFNTAKTYYGEIYTNNEGTAIAENYTEGTTYYAKIIDKLNDKSGCGLTYNDYETTYKKMLKSIYDNGGFYIARFEAGIKGSIEDISVARGGLSPRINDSSLDAISKKDAIPYICIQPNEAQMLASRMTPDSNRTSSLLFGIQWDLICKFLEVKSNLKEEDINRNSGNFGNYSTVELTIDSEKARQLYHGVTGWSIISGQKPKIADLLTTGASESTRVLNIYDLAGNDAEYCLGKGYNVQNTPRLGSLVRGGHFYGSGAGSVMAIVFGISPDEYPDFCTFRATFY